MKIPKTWTFENKEVANDFDNHVREQLPWYDFITQSVIHIARFIYHLMVWYMILVLLLVILVIH